MTLKQYVNLVRGKIGNKKKILKKTIFYRQTRAKSTKTELCGGENAYCKGLL